MPSDSAFREAVLRDCIREVYLTFRRYPLASRIEPNEYRPGYCDERPLRAAPLHRLPAEAFGVYQWKAMNGWGSVNDFKHFLPRMLEIIAVGPNVGRNGQATAIDSNGRLLEGVESWLAFSKLKWGDWRHWRPQERRVLVAYFDALWAALLQRPVDMTDIAWETPSMGEWLQNLAEAHDDVSRFLDKWEADSSDSEFGLMPAAHLANTIVRSCERLMRRGKVDWDIYNGLRPSERHLIDWLAADVNESTLEAAFFRWSESSYGKLLSEGGYWLAWLRGQHADR